MAVSIITGARQAGRSPFAMEFWMLVTSPVSRVTRDEVRNRSVLEKENCWSFRYSSFRIWAPIPCPQTAANLALPVPRSMAATAQPAICSPFLKM